MQALISALNGQGKDRLDLPAFDLASIEFPSLDARPYLERLEEMGAELSNDTTGMNGPQFIARANTFLFDDIKFRGNEKNYYDPKNSCLNWVLDRRTGIPITLSLVYLEIARRAKRPMAGIGLPGHFVIKYDDGQYRTYIDPFNCGKLLNERECIELSRGIAGAGAVSDANLLRPVGPQYIFTRMLNNLRAAYFKSESFARAVQVLDLLIQSSPSAADYLKSRGVAHAHLRHFRAASADFEAYLKLSPNAEDREAIVKQMVAIHQWIGSLN